MLRFAHTGSTAPPFIYFHFSLLPTSSAGLHGSILRAGALWLIGVCGGELQPAPWAEACALTVQHVAHADVVVSVLPPALTFATCLVPTLCSAAGNSAFQWMLPAHTAGGPGDAVSTWVLLPWGSEQVSRQSFLRV